MDGWRNRGEENFFGVQSSGSINSVFSQGLTSADQHRMKRGADSVDESEMN